MDEDALNVLLAEGIDVPTAYAASASDADPPSPCEADEPAVGFLADPAVGLGAAIGFLLLAAWWILF